MTDNLLERARFVVQLFRECDAIQLPHGPTEQVLTGMIDRIEELQAKLAQQDDLVQAAVAAALREAAEQAEEWGAIVDHPSVYMGGPSRNAQRIAKGFAKEILALITPDAQAALDRVVAAEREKIKGLVIIDDAGTVTPEMWDITAAIRKGEK